MFAHEKRALPETAAPVFFCAAGAILNPMLHRFFSELRAAKIPVTTREYLTLLEALEKGAVDPDIDHFYSISRAVLIKDEKNFDKFDAVFGHVFKGVETLGSLFETRCCLSAGTPKGVAVGTFFIDQGETDSSSVTWLEAASHCMAAGKRLCSSQEWVTACGNAAGFGIVGAAFGLGFVLGPLSLLPSLVLEPARAPEGQEGEPTGPDGMTEAELEAEAGTTL